MKLCEFDEDLLFELLALREQLKKTTETRTAAKRHSKAAEGGASTGRFFLPPYRVAIRHSPPLGLRSGGGLTRAGNEAAIAPLAVRNSSVVP